MASDFDKDDRDISVFFPEENAKIESRVYRAKPVKFSFQRMISQLGGIVVFHEYQNRPVYGILIAF